MFLPVLDPDSHALFDVPANDSAPERRLLVAMLERALLDYVGNDSLEVEAAHAWIFAFEATADDHFSFPWLCQQLDLDVVAIRGFIKAMPKRGKNRIAPWYFIKGRTFKPEGAKARKLAKNSDYFSFP